MKMACFMQDFINTLRQSYLQDCLRVLAVKDMACEQRYILHRKTKQMMLGLAEIGDFSSLGTDQSIKELTVAGYYENVIETAWKMD